MYGTYCMGRIWITWLFLQSESRLKNQLWMSTTSKIKPSTKEAKPYPKLNLQLYLTLHFHTKYLCYSVSLRMASWRLMLILLRTQFPCSPINCTLPKLQLFNHHVNDLSMPPYLYKLLRLKWGRYFTKTNLNSQEDEPLPTYNCHTGWNLYRREITQHPFRILRKIIH